MMGETKKGQNTASGKKIFLVFNRYIFTECMRISVAYYEI